MIIKSIGLFIAISISFLSLYSYDMMGKKDSDYNELLDVAKIFLPGVSFSLFIVLQQTNYLSFLKLILLFVILMAGYYVNLMIGFSTWGIGVPIAGGLGGILIALVMSYVHRPSDSLNDIYFRAGLVSSLIGLLFYYATKDFLNDGMGFAGIIILWQIAVGIQFIKQTQLYVKDKTS